MGKSLTSVHSDQHGSPASNAEQELAELRSQLHALNKSLAVMELSLDGIILSANEKFLAMLGYRAQEIINQHHRMLVDPEYRDSLEYEQFWHKLGCGEFDQAQYKRIGKDGREVWIEASYNPIFDLEGRPCKIVKYATDITEQKRKDADYLGQINALSKSQGVIEFSLDGIILSANDRFLAMLGYQAEDIINHHHSMLVEQEYRTSEAYQQFWQKLGRGEFDQAQYKRIGKDGREVWIEASYNPIFDQNGKSYKIVKFATDITQQVLLARSVKTLSNDTLRQMNEGTPIAEVLQQLFVQIEANYPSLKWSILLIGNHRGSIKTQIAPGLSDLLDEMGLSLTMVNVSLLSTPKVSTNHSDSVEDLLQHDEWLKYEQLASQAGLQTCYVHHIKDSYDRLLAIYTCYKPISSSPSHHEIDVMERFANLLQLAAERDASAQKIEHMAFHDELTGLANRRLLIDRLEQAASSSARNNHHVAILFMDLDNFKALNDSKGHSAGDQLLIEIARRLTISIRKVDTVARMGGDEFVLILNMLSSDVDLARRQIEKIAEKIRLDINRISITRQINPAITTSMGINLFKGNGNLDDLIKQADMAMYQSKLAGRNSIHFFKAAMQTSLDRRTSLEGDLRVAVKRNQFSLYYQPQVYQLDPDSEYHIFGAEVLLRWFHPSLGQVPPLSFIPLAEETGLIYEIGLYVLESACQQLKQWESDPLKAQLLLSVNVSPIQFSHAQFVEQVCGILESSQANPYHLKLEITETITIKNVDDTIAKINALKAVGVRFSMDDFGTGYSSLSSLKQLPIDQLKIDQSFVKDITTEPSDFIIAKTIVAMGNALELDVIAEGVETECQLELLKQCLCTAFQGYYFGRPVPLEEFEALL